MRAYLNIRPDTDSDALCVIDAGKSISYDGGRMIWCRMQKRSGVKRLWSHLVRHSYAQNVARKGAPIADIQDVLDRDSDKMARHYAGEARKFEAAEQRSKYRLAS